MKALNWALPQSNTFGIAALHPRPEPRQSTALAAAQDEVGRGFTVELIKNTWPAGCFVVCTGQVGHYKIKLNMGAKISSLLMDIVIF